MQSTQKGRTEISESFKDNLVTHNHFALTRVQELGPNKQCLLLPRESLLPSMEGGGRRGGEAQGHVLPTGCYPQSF